MDTTAAKVAEFLLEISAIKLNPEQPFTWTSGWKSPIYSDNRLTLSFPEVRGFIKSSLGQLIQQQFSGTEAIIGVATAGIAPGALVADYLNLPFGYVRSEAKKHGMGKQIEGSIQPGTKVVVVEDLVSTGKSSIHAVEVLKAAGCEVLGLVAIFTYGFPLASESFRNAGCPFYALSNYEALIPVAIQKGVVREDQMDLLAQWRKSPESWGL